MSRFRKRVEKQTETEYRWRASFHAPRGITPAAVYEELEAVRVAHGSLDADAVVEAAAAPASVLHKCFEWDDRKCGLRYRRYQAQTLIRAIVVVEKGAPDHRVYTMVSRPTEEASAKETAIYVPTSDVIDRPDLFADACARLGRQISEAEESLAELERVAHHVSVDADKMARIALAAKGLDAARMAIQGLH